MTKNLPTKTFFNRRKALDTQLFLSTVEIWIKDIYGKQSIYLISIALAKENIACLHDVARQKKLQLLFHSSDS